jgi:hypothetical protein
MGQSSIDVDDPGDEQACSRVAAPLGSEDSIGRRHDSERQNLKGDRS